MEHCPLAAENAAEEGDGPMGGDVLGLGYVSGEDSADDADAVPPHLSAPKAAATAASPSTPAEVEATGLKLEEGVKLEEGLQAAPEDRKSVV